MVRCKFLLITLLFIIAGCTAYSQSVKQPVKTSSFTPITKFKPPVVKTYLGKNTNGATVLKEEADQLIKMPLKVTDEKNNTYAISSYQFLYKKKNVFENEETGKKETAFTNVADLFKTTPLPEVWRSNIGGGLQKDEELYFFDIIVTDKLNRKFFAPELKITVQ